MKYEYKNRELLTGVNSRIASPKVQKQVWQRDKGVCIYCGNPAADLDHVIRWGDNAPSISSNLVCSCHRCNIYKGKHPRGLKQLTRAIFWLMTHDENVSWMDKFYPDIEANLKRPKTYTLDRERQIKTKEIADALISDRVLSLVLPPRVKKPKKRSKTTTAVAFRVSNKVYEIIQRRIQGKRSRWTKVSDYLRERVIYDILRKH